MIASNVEWRLGLSRLPRREKPLRDRAIIVV